MNQILANNAELCLRGTLALVHFLWQGTAIALLVMAAAWCLRRSSANVRYVVNVGWLLLMFACVPATFVLLGRASAPSATTLQPHRDQTPSGSHEGADTNTAATTASPPEYRSISPALPTQPMGSNNAVAAPPAEPPVARAQRALGAAPVYALSAYLLGVAAMLVRLVVGLCGTQRLRSISVPVDDTLAAVVLRKAARIGLKAAPAVAWCQRVSVPVVAGICRPMILLPTALATGLTPAQFESLLVHELAHIRRYDLIVNLFQRLVEALLFFHPAVWYVSRQLSRERERACDDFVVSLGTRRIEYAEALLRMAEICAAARGLILGQSLNLAATGTRLSDLRSRIARLLGAQPEPQLRLSWRAVAAAVLLAVAAVIATPLTMTLLADANARKAVDKLVPDATEEQLARLNNVLSTSPDVSGFAAQIPMDQTVEVTGTVIGADGQLAAGADVWAAAVHTHLPHRERTRSDEQGRFRLHLKPLVEPDFWSVGAFRGYEGGEAKASEGSIEITQGKPSKPIEIRLQERGKLTGRAWPEEPGPPFQVLGPPLGGARIYLDDGRIIVTDAEGRFELAGLEQMNHSAIIVYPGRRRLWFCFETTGQHDAQLNIWVPLGGTVRGRVLDEAGKPIPRAAVSIPGSGSALALDGRKAISADDGTFVYDALPYDTPFMGIHVNAPGYEEHQQGRALVNSNEQPSELVFRLKQEPEVHKPGPTVRLLWNNGTTKYGGFRGRVLTPWGTPAMNFRILLSGESSHPTDQADSEKWGGFSSELSGIGTSYTNANGEFVLTGIEVGNFVRVIAESDGHGHAEVDRVVSQPLDKISESPLIELKLAPVEVLMLSVRSAVDDAPLPNVAIQYTLRNASSAFRWPFDDLGLQIQRTHIKGGAEVLIRDREATLLLSAAGYARQRVACRRGQKELTVRLQPESIVEGTILTHDGKPLANNETVVSLKLESDKGDSFWTEFLSDKPGHFRMGELPAGSYKATVFDSNGQPHAETLELATGERKSLTIRLPEKFGKPQETAK